MLIKTSLDIVRFQQKQGMGLKKPLADWFKKFINFKHWSLQSMNNYKENKGV